MSEQLTKTLTYFETSKLNTKVRFPSPAPMFPTAAQSAALSDHLELTMGRYRSRLMRWSSRKLSVMLREMRAVALGRP